MVQKTLLLAFASLAVACSNGPTGSKNEIQDSPDELPYELAMVDDSFDTDGADVEQEESDEELRRSFKVGKGGFKKKKQELKETFDADKDGKLSKEERVDACNKGKERLAELAQTKPEKAKKARTKICGFASRRVEKLKKKNVPLSERPALECIVKACNDSTKSTAAETSAASEDEDVLADL